MKDEAERSMSSPVHIVGTEVKARALMGNEMIIYYICLNIQAIYKSLCFQNLKEQLLEKNRNIDNYSI